MVIRASRYGRTTLPINVLTRLDRVPCYAQFHQSIRSTTWKTDNMDIYLLTIASHSLRLPHSPRLNSLGESVSSRSVVNQSINHSVRGRERETGRVINSKGEKKETGQARRNKCIKQPLIGQSAAIYVCLQIKWIGGGGRRPLVSESLKRRLGGFSILQTTASNTRNGNWLTKGRRLGSIKEEDD